MLSAAERKELKARAHKLEPVVLIGSKGVSEEVLKEVERALRAHELIKVRATGLEREERAGALKTLCELTGAQAVQSIGKVFVMYRKRDDK
jgi:RNA-binding protein